MSNLKRENTGLKGPVPSLAQRKYLQKGVQHRWGRLPLFDEDGQRYADRTVEACVHAGWVRPAYKKTFLVDMEIFRLTDAGRQALSAIKKDNVVDVNWNQVARSDKLV